MQIDPVLARADEQLSNALDRLQNFLRIPSISTDPKYTMECERAAGWLARELESLGVDVQTFETDLHPIIVGKIEGDGPHLLFYGHYDVQPVDPVDLWHHDPFDPIIEDTDNGQVVRARGASDDKGQLMTFVEACRAYIDTFGSLPCRVTFLFEGEEEIGSPSLLPFLRAHSKLLLADIAAICDTAMIADDVPSIVSQLRGILEEEFTLHGPSIDLHSGDYGGPAVNPLKELGRVIASFHNDEGTVLVDGFYDDVPDVSPDLLANWDNCGFDEDSYLQKIGLTVASGERGRSSLEQQWALPTLEINGIWGGYQGPGSKTVIPAEAHCKLTFRLVGKTDPEKFGTLSASTSKIMLRLISVCHGNRPLRVHLQPL
ncbi:Acetylornithine deacetylase/Succinyl-diaminopimelate desuccinylase [Ruegeria halocynthiae]|uniref:Acetylornithine deacetylase/Succinyl-diaminopimelate desuccinylase n=1 Tax=Ruegeria halocynthiae TaxID=985054 RepID=A0A1H3EIY5_9RHOB|nr:Acetylornithine deacetylase/Succinyl-diaminopimelate desuccinylase [Ruegeria halocynthiae]